MDDSALNRLITTLPPKSIALMEDIDVAFTRGPARDQPRSPVSKRDEFSMGFSDQWGPIDFAMPAPSSAGGGITLAGLLGAIDGVAAQEGRILFATTNRYQALDSALKRPGRLDIHFEFKEANRKQAEELFKRFYPANKEIGSGTADLEKPLIDLSGEVKANTNGPSTPLSEPHTTEGRDIPSLSPTELNTLAQKFATRLPEREFSMATIQGHLMRYKRQPFTAIEEVEVFVERERKQREVDRVAREAQVQNQNRLAEEKRAGGGGGEVNGDVSSSGGKDRVSGEGQSGDFGGYNERMNLRRARTARGLQQSAE